MLQDVILKVYCKSIWFISQVLTIFCKNLSKRLSVFALNKDGCFCHISSKKRKTAKLIKRLLVTYYIGLFQGTLVFCHKEQYGNTVLNILRMVFLGGGNIPVLAGLLHRPH